MKRDDWKVGDIIDMDMSFAAVTASADAPEGYIVGTASAPHADLANHKVIPHAFDESIRTKGLTGPKGVKLLAYHDWKKPAGVIKKLETRPDKTLGIEAQLNTGISYVKDMYMAAKDNGGLSFSVGFRLEDFEFEEEKDHKGRVVDEFLVIKKGELMEVSVVCFPCQPDATMSFIKSFQPDTVAEFEKVLRASGFAYSRKEAHRLMLAFKDSVHLFQDKPAPLAPSAVTLAHPLLDGSKLQAAMDLAVKARQLLSQQR